LSSLNEQKRVFDHDISLAYHFMHYTIDDLKNRNLYDWRLSKLGV